MTNIQRRSIKIVIGLFFLAFPFLFFKLKFYIFSDRIKLDGKKAEILNIFRWADTEYSSGYTHERFAKIKVGMTERQVVEILGLPQKKWKPYDNSMKFPDKKHYVGLQYSISPTGTHYRLRQVYLDSGIVARVINYFYLD